MARRTDRGTGFDALRIEGGLLPAEFLNTIASLQAPAQSEADYAIDPGLKLRDEIGRYWRIAHTLWQRYDDQSPRADLNARDVGIKRWLVYLFQRVLGYDDLAATAPLTIDERRFPITHRACGGAVPLVLTTRDRPLDKGDPRFGEEGRKRSPHGLAQEYLNAEEACLWALVSNGTHLRLLRDNPSMTRPAYIEVDLERMFREELYPDFAAFWLICHASRLRPGEPARPESCIIEGWRNQAQETGERALEHLREGVERALRELGSGFLEHPDNHALRQAIETGVLSGEAYFQQLLRLIYRLIFLFTAEDRDILHRPAASAEARALYRDGYSVSQLRERASRSRGDRHHDLWQGLKITVQALQSGEDALGLPPLGGLFDARQCADLDKARLPNTRLLAAVHALTWFRSNNALSRINYRDMDTEELGSVYESLLELVPVIQVESRPWSFGFLGDPVPGQAQPQQKKRGGARKTTGSYYTPDGLVQELIQSALAPVIERALKENPDKPVEALLALKIVDPAVGSGHFLLAAARRLAAEVARLQAGADQPTEADYRHALREVVAHCIYGVDLNPLAVELCKTALWLETVEPGKPLGFLDAHIRCGNALVGVLDPAILKDGIPDAAYKPLTGDDKKAAAQLRKANKAAREGGVQALDFSAAVAEPELCAVDLDHMPEDTPAQIADKRAAWEAAQASRACRHQRQLADLFTAAFFAPKTLATLDAVPTSADLADWREGRAVRAAVAQQAEELAAAHRFFHWHIEFPEVFARGGFDCVLGNPPWDQLQFDPREFFSTRVPAIANAQHASARSMLIDQLEDENPSLYRRYQVENDKILRQQAFVHEGGRFPLTAFGRINFAPLFAELSVNLLNENGRSGIVVPSGIATDSFTQKFFRSLFEGNRLISLYDFENREALFPGVHRSYKFSLLTLGSHAPEADFLFFATRMEHLKDPRRHFTLSAADIALINPNTRTCPVFRSRRDAELTKQIYRRVPVLIDEAEGETGNPWGINFMLMFMMNTASHLFRTHAQLAEAGASPKGPNWVLPDGELYVPLYEAKMVHQFDHRWAEYEEDGKTTRDLSDEDHADATRSARPRYWVSKPDVEKRLQARDWQRGWLLGWRDICRSTDERTVIAGVVPRVGVGNNLPLMFPGNQYEPLLSAALVANLSSIAFDFVARHKVGGTHLNFFIIKQLPVLPPDTYRPADLDFIVPRVLELTYVASDLRPWAEDLGYRGDPFPWNPDRRRQLRAELDAYYARLYGLTRIDLRYILDPADVEGDDYPSETFRVLKKNDINTFGDYRTRLLVLDAWDRLEKGALQ